MDIDLKQMAEAVRNYAGVYRKRPIKDVVEKLRQTHRFGTQLPNYGDDAAVIPWKDEYLLLAADGMMTGLLIHEPYAAGKASVMVTVNDIYAMGGRPMGLVNVLASGDELQREQIVAGIEKGCRKLEVPMLGGHLHPDAPDTQPALSVAILGHAKHLMRSHLARPGDDLVVAVDLAGRAGCRSVVSWDANSGKSPEQLKKRLETLPRIADEGLCLAAKDISNAGLVGTAAIMMENSGTGAMIDLLAIPKPDTLDLSQWVICFQSFGFVFSVHPEKTDSLIELFEARSITAKRIGRVTPGTRVELRVGEKSETLFDFSTDEITGIRYQGAMEPV